ncbi:type II secretion system ATPase GspE [Thiomicrorhabdus sp. ZW0627]|uniref:type II secretion system ATPase GspE n=1 Tax=Thiomicrorhabdus sp. ZW0627 TaxID=3039774 RepID=UPI00243679FB|nr:type II secretion system ATPase GspE [Thiomicrorhabdus sp. ZW0627]MDG6773664.1 type II secretion system ATPase GspE [Thiomicrorhabdus sp. ZW0627]
MNTELAFSFARTNEVVMTPLEDGRVGVFYTQKTPTSAFLELQRRVEQAEKAEQCDIVFQQLDEQTFERKLQSAYAGSGQSSIATIDEFENEDLASVVAELGEPEDLLNSADDAPVIKLLNAILAEAIRANASDVHIEPFESQLRIRFRIDGRLSTVLTPKPGIGSMLVSRIKVMARLDIAEKRLPQDGRIALKLGGRAVDLRVSTIPSSFGERVVMRLLDKSAGRLNLNQLGLSEPIYAGIQKLLNKPHGIFLVTGPTGSGKTTTLYAGLSRLNDTQRNIMTVEDPVEYNIDGISQTQVNTKADMTFAKGLRAILRQDPDVVMIGEIRDIETAEIAVQASLTGHLVLSTLHTNTAVGAITRLRDMGIEPFLLSSSLIGVLAQRLVRRLCPHCKQEHQADSAECETLGVDQALIYQHVGCDHCQHTGYQGRMGLYELVTIDDQVRQMIHADESELDIERYVHKDSKSLLESGLDKVLSGETSLEEVLRVTQN